MGFLYDTLLYDGIHVCQVTLTSINIWQSYDWDMNFYTDIHRYPDGLTVQQLNAAIYKVGGGALKNKNE